MKLNIPKWAHGFLSVLFTVGGVYVSSQYPQFAGLIGTLAGVLGLGTTVSAFNNDPTPK